MNLDLFNIQFGGYNNLYNSDIKVINLESYKNSLNSNKSDIDEDLNRDIDVNREKDVENRLLSFRLEDDRPSTQYNNT